MKNHSAEVSMILSVIQDAFKMLYLKSDEDFNTSEICRGAIPFQDLKTVSKMNWLLLVYKQLT